MDSASAHHIEEWDSFTVKRASKSHLVLAGDGRVTRACTGLMGSSKGRDIPCTKAI